jgi:hypothetical protein
MHHAKTARGAARVTRFTGTSTGLPPHCRATTSPVTPPARLPCSPSSKGGWLTGVFDASPLTIALQTAATLPNASYVSVSAIADATVARLTPLRPPPLASSPPPPIHAKPPSRSLSSVHA